MGVQVSKLFFYLKTVVCARVTWRRLFSTLPGIYCVYCLIYFNFISAFFHIFYPRTVNSGIFRSTKSQTSVSNTSRDCSFSKPTSDSWSLLYLNQAERLCIPVYWSCCQSRCYSSLCLFLRHDVSMCKQNAQYAKSPLSLTLLFYIGEENEELQSQGRVRLFHGLANCLQ